MSYDLRLEVAKTVEQLRLIADDLERPAPPTREYEQREARNPNEMRRRARGHGRPDGPSAKEWMTPGPRIGSVHLITASCSGGAANAGGNSPPTESRPTAGRGAVSHDVRHTIAGVVDDVLRVADDLERAAERLRQLARYIAEEGAGERVQPDRQPQPITPLATPPPMSSSAHERMLARRASPEPSGKLEHASGTRLPTSRQDAAMRARLESQRLAALRALLASGDGLTTQEDQARQAVQTRAHQALRAQRCVRLPPPPPPRPR